MTAAFLRTGIVFDGRIWPAIFDCRPF